MAQVSDKLWWGHSGQCHEGNTWEGAMEWGDREAESNSGLALLFYFNPFYSPFHWGSMGTTLNFSVGSDPVT